HHCKSASYSNLTPQGDVAAVRCSNALNHCEAESCSASLCFSGRRLPVEIKCIRHILRHHSLSVISNAQHEKLATGIDAPSLDYSRLDLNAAACVGELNSIGHKIDKSANKQLAIAQNRGQVLRGSIDNRDLLLQSESVHFGKSRAHNRACIERHPSHCYSLAVEFGQVEKICNKTQNSL